MRFLKLYRYDLRQGLLAYPMKWAGAVLLSMFLFLCFWLDVFHLFYFQVEGPWQINTLGLSFADVVLSPTGGVLPLGAIDTAQDFTFPVKWLFLHGLILYFTLSYTSDDLTHCGMQVITRTGNKWLWWLSKCLWNATAVISYYFVYIGILFLLSWVTGKTMDMTLNPSVFMAIFAESLPTWVQSGSSLFFAVCIMPCAVGIAMSLFQMLLTLYVKPVIAYLLMCVYLIAGVFYVHPALLSNYALTVRNQAVGLYPLQSAGGLMLCDLVSVAVILLGGIRLQKMDLV